MKFSVSTDVLSTAMTHVARIAKNHSTVPMLQYVLVSAKDRSITLTATDLETSLTYTIEGSVHKDGEAAVPAKILATYLAALSDPTLTWSQKPKGATLVSGSSSATFNTLPAEEFPTLPKPKSSFSITLEGSALHDLLERTLYAMKTAAIAGNSQPALSGVLMELGGKYISMVATDNFRLAYARHTASRELEPTRVIIPATAATEIARHAKNASSVTLSFLGSNRNHLRVKAGSAVLTTRLLDASYPDYANVIPKAFDRTMIISAAALREALNRVRILASETKAAVCTMRQDTFSIRSYSEAFGEVEERVPCSLTGEELTITLKATFLADAIAQFAASDEIKIEAIGALSPVAIKETKGNNRIGVIMPLRS